MGHSPLVVSTLGGNHHANQCCRPAAGPASSGPPRFHSGRLGGTRSVTGRGHKSDRSGHSDRRSASGHRLGDADRQIRACAKGVHFSKAFVVNPLCCPSRSTILTGNYSHTTDVYKNDPPHGGFPSFKDGSTLASWLHSAGYEPALIGKYLNAYTGARSSYIPPGWDRWVAFTTQNGNGDYYNYSLNVDGAAESHGSSVGDYSTDILAAKAEAFIRDASPDQPLFLYFTPNAPHAPYTPPERYKTAFSNLPVWRPPSFNEADVSDKPAYIRNHALAKPTAVETTRKKQYRSLLAVDDAVLEVLGALTDTGRLTNALVIFASDNGYSWGEHRWTSKTVPYEESIRVPLIIRYDQLTTTARTDSHLALNLDLAPTITDVTGAAGAGSEGSSLLPLLSQTAGSWRSDFLIEHLASFGVPSYCAVRNDRYVYVAYGTGEKELYDPQVDPYELSNQSKNAALASIKVALRDRLRRLCSPPPPGYTVP